MLYKVITSMEGMTISKVYQIHLPKNPISTLLLGYIYTSSASIRVIPYSTKGSRDKTFAVFVVFL